MKLKAFFIIFKGLSRKQITQFFLEGESPTLSLEAITKYVNIEIKKKCFEFSVKSGFSY